MTVDTARFATRAVHAARSRETAASRATPIYLTAGFEFDDFDHATDHFSTGAGFGYTRTGNPTVHAVERQLAALEGGAEAVLVASGQAAVVTAILAVAGAGDHIVSSTHIYEGSRGLFLDSLARLGIETTFIDDIADPDAWRAAVRPHTRALFAESLANARNDVLDVAAVAAVADDHAIPLIVDNTLATPYLFRPLEHGAAIVVHSASKFLAGHGSVLGGVIVDDGRFPADSAGHNAPHLVLPGRGGAPSVVARHGGRARIAYAREVVAPRFGASPSPLNAFLIGQGAETLGLRVERQSRNALEVARWLEAHDAVESVDYVGLPSHPDHERALRYLEGGFGSIFTFTLRGGLDAARRFVEQVSVFTHMTHIGDVRSLVLHPATTSHAQRTDEERAILGVRPGTLRLSIGIEDIEDLLTDLSRVLQPVKETDR
ncbi:MULTISPECIES: O-acetylhomoserine aminocarboxypropyltransferase/cysteine synthase family protein [unclassified Microbacterium]|uniref:O-acetylhomoserine aminocarboxypropyltransferase/cysteine synthase family protein n=1 Tax=unclassified Microbacterium TaxID=2609290 RepID=UPI000EA9A8C0|nr:MULTISPECIES: PLP-dependent transferase [unclassified Microbacterium]MBT2485673.1 O-acetylhomoserine aminocarboxypropyltransferase/cysteine synthase [Microbacterium sp. ISL-108]RKN68449.1 O-acetylhomoserine aminocarboxypropyltransferase/cysteine synthase [Microbacterium sp. CGR2]